MNLRPGVPSDCPTLEAIAFAAKAHWGYSVEQLQAWRDDLAVPEKLLPIRPVVVAELNGRPVGFAQVATDTQPWELWAMWVHPEHMGQGIGTALFAWATGFAAEHGQEELTIDSDPNAEGFYLRRGARRIGELAAPIPGDSARVRPQLLLAARLIAVNHFKADTEAEL